MRSVCRRIRSSGSRGWGRRGSGRGGLGHSSGSRRGCCRRSAGIGRWSGLSRRGISGRSCRRSGRRRSRGCRLIRRRIIRPIRVGPRRSDGRSRDYCGQAEGLQVQFHLSCLLCSALHWRTTAKSSAWHLAATVPMGKTLENGRIYEGNTHLYGRLVHH